MNDRLAKLEHVDSFLDFDSELASLIISLVPLFASHSVSNMDIQREFESAAHDEGLLNEEDNEEENEDIAVMTLGDDKVELKEETPEIKLIEKQPSVEKDTTVNVVKSSLQSPTVSLAKTPLQSPIKVRVKTPQRIEKGKEDKMEQKESI